MPEIGCPAKNVHNPPFSFLGWAARERGRAEEEEEGGGAGLVAPSSTAA